MNGTWTCYTFVRLQKTWEQAKEYCASRGGALAGPDTREKADAVYRTAKQYVANANGYYWLGATDAVRRNAICAEIYCISLLSLA